MKIQEACKVSLRMGALAMAVALLPSVGFAQETDITQTPNAANAGIKKSYTEQIGAGRGDVLTPGSSLFIINCLYVNF